MIYSLGGFEEEQTSGKSLCHPPADFNHIDSEVAAIRSSLELCAVEGLEELAYREAKAVKTMGVDEPYRIAVERL